MHRDCCGTLFGRSIFAVLTTLTLTLWLAALSAQGREWNQWRGAARDGRVATFAPPASWPDRPKQAWKVAGAGSGHSSPVVAGDRVFLFSRIGEQEAMTAYDAATGKPVWRETYDAPYQMNSAATAHGKGPKSTPAVDRGQVFSLGISGILSAFDAATGKVLWRHDFKKEFRNTSPDFGAAMSPLVDGDSVIAHVGGAGNGAIVAFARASGAQRWTWKGDGPAYASPIIATVGGARHLVTQTQSSVVGLSPADGRELWRIPFTTDYDQNAVTPFASNGMLIYGGLSKPTTAVRIVQQGNAWKPEQVWQNADVPMYMSSPVAAGAVVYGMTHRNRGQIFALDAKSGKTLWTGPPRLGENAALAVAGDVVIATTTEGKLVVFRQGTKTFEAVREYSLADSPVWAHPAFHRRGILIKDAETLSLWTF
jgi:outer membrane protein assembly factor BamB